MLSYTYISATKSHCCLIRKNRSEEYWYGHRLPDLQPQEAPDWNIAVSHAMSCPTPWPAWQVQLVASALRSVLLLAGPVIHVYICLSHFAIGYCLKGEILRIRWDLGVLGSFKQGPSSAGGWWWLLRLCQSFDPQRRGGNTRPWDAQPSAFQIFQPRLVWQESLWSPFCRHVFPSSCCVTECNVWIRSIIWL